MRFSSLEKTQGRKWPSSQTSSQSDSLILKICWLFGMVTANDLWNEKFFPNPVSFSINVLHDVLFASCLNSATLKIFSNINVHFNSLLWSLFWYLAFMICLHPSTISGAISRKVSFSQGFTWRRLRYWAPPKPPPLHCSTSPSVSPKIFFFRSHEKYNNNFFLCILHALRRR